MKNAKIKKMLHNILQFKLIKGFCHFTIYLLLENDYNEK